MNITGVHRGRREDGYLVEFERPVNVIDPGGLAAHFASVTPIVEIPGRHGCEVSVDWGNAFDPLPGTKIEPQAFAAWLLDGQGSTRGEVSGLISALTGEEKGKQGKPLVSVKKGCVRLEIYAGCNCLQAVNISNLGSGPALDVDQRLSYQTSFYVLTQPFLADSLPRLEALFDGGRPIIYEADDCMAALTTLGSTAAIFNQRIGLDKLSGRVIDLGIATAQGLVMAITQANLLSLPTVMRTGIVEFGLSEGLGPDQDHKDYIMTTEADHRKEGLFGCGDVGDAAKRLPATFNHQAPWNTDRVDDYWDRDTVTTTHMHLLNKPGGSVVFAYTMGGWMVKAFRDCALNGLSPDQNLIVAQASRKGKGEEFYVAINHLLEPLDRWKASLTG